MDWLIWSKKQSLRVGMEGGREACCGLEGFKCVLVASGCQHSPWCAGVEEWSPERWGLAGSHS